MDEPTVLIWTHEVPPAVADAVEAQLRDLELPTLERLEGWIGGDLLRSSDSGVVRFTVISRWQPKPASRSHWPPMSASEGSITEHRPVSRGAVDLDVDLDVPGEAGVTVSSYATTPERPGRGRREMLVVTGALVLAAVVLAWIGSHDDAEPAAQPPPSTALSSPSAAASPSVVRSADQAFVPWPDPPADHDPHVSGRPGSGSPVGEASPGQSIVYVNDRQRPTLIDLGTGDQHELDFAETRATDSFLVEGGAVVVADELDPDFPLGTDRAWLFRVVIDDSVDGVDGRPAPTLCLSAVPSCLERAWTDGRFGDAAFHVDSLDGDPVAVLGELIGASSWTTEERWTTFDVAGGVESFRWPTPAADAVVWSISEPV